MTIREEILTIANQIANQGKTPSVALIKTKLTSPVPLPVIISTLKNWQHNPDYISIENTAQRSEKISADHHINKNLAEALNREISQTISQTIEQAVEQAVMPLRAELSEIKTLLLALTDIK